MLVELKRRDVLELYFAIKGLGDDNFSKWFTYSIILNEERLKPIATAIIEVSKPSEDYKDYEEQRENIINKYVELDDDKERIVKNNQVKICDDKFDEYTKEMNILDLDYKSIIGVRNKDLKEYYELLDGKIDVDVEQVDFKYFPENISKQFMLALMPLVKKTEEE